MSVFEKALKVSGPMNTPISRSGIFDDKSVAMTPKIQHQLIISDAEIDRIGESVSRELGQTTQKIIDKMGVGKFDELGTILTAIHLEADKLDPANISKRGIVGWVQRQFTDVKSQLTLRLKSAQEVFKGLEDKISMHITTQQEWVSDLDSLYMENYNHYKKIVSECQEVGRIISHAENQLINWPEINPESQDAVMQVQLKRDAESKIGRLHLKLDNLKRLQAMTEINSPKIRQQQDASRATISTMKDIISQTIPIIKMEFAMFLQTLDVQKSVQLTSEVRDLATKTLTKGAEGAKMAAIESAKAMTTPVITNETLKTLRDRMLETVLEVRQVETNAVARSKADALGLVEDQKSLLTALQRTNIIN